MKRFFRVSMTLLAAVYIWGGGGQAVADGPRPKGRVSLVIAAEAGAPIISYHTWSKDLGEAGVRNVRVRAGRSNDRLAIKSRGSQQMPVYDVTGIIRAGGDLLLPGARFKPGDADGVARWVKDLAELGPPQSREPKGVFGLTKSQFDRVREDLARRVNFSTQGETPAAVIDKIAAKLQVPLPIEPRLKATLAQDVLADELAGFSSGTVLAYVLRPLGLGYVPREVADRRLQYVVVPLGAESAVGIGKDKPMKHWSVGWPPSGSKREVLPELFKFHNVSIQDVSVGKVLEAVGEKLKAPVLLDRAALARHGIDLEKIDVTLPSKRTTYGLVLNRALFKAKLRYDLRVDEAGKPFLWVTTLKPAFGVKR